MNCRWSFKLFGRCILLVGTTWLPIGAQEPQFLPEIDAHLKLNSSFQTYFEVKNDRDGGDPAQFTIGPSARFALKPLIKLKHITKFDLDDLKARQLVLEAGYRYISRPDSPSKNRLLVAATGNFPLLAGFHLADRSRMDFDWENGVFTWRYRNKLTLQRTFAAGSYHFTPYVAAESYYTSTYSKWNATDLFAGCLWPLGKHVELNTYYEHENSTGGHPNKQQNYVGLILDLYFSVAKP